MSAEAESASFLVRNKEIIAGFGILLGLVPRVLDMLVQASVKQKEQRRLTLEQQHLEIAKLRHEIEKIRRDLGEPSMPVASLAVSDAIVGGAERPGIGTTALEHRIPEWVQWLRRHRTGRVLLGAAQVLLGLFAVMSGFAIVGIPAAILAEGQSKNWGLLASIEITYILMAWAFVVMYRKVRGWRRADHPVP